MIETFDVKPSALTVARSNMSPNPTYPNGSSSTPRIGWRNVSEPTYARYYHYFFTFDFSEFVSRRVTPNNLVSAKYIISSGTGVHGLTTSFYRVLKNVTNSLDWQTYNGSNAWSVAGGTGNGTDRAASALINMSESRAYELAIDASTLFSIYNDAWKFGIYTTSSRPPYDNYSARTYDHTVIRIVYNRYGLTGDAMVF